MLAPRLPGGRIPDSVAPGTHRIGVLIAYTPIHHLVFEALKGCCAALVMTSANDHDEPLIFRNEEAVAQLGGMCDAILWHERPIERPVDDSVLLDAQDRDPIFFRRSRGVVPTAIGLPDSCRSSGICVGPDLKNTVAVVRDGEVVLSQHLGNLENAHTYANFKRAVEDLVQLHAVRPRWVARDAHPTYVSTMFAGKLAKSLNLPQIAIQHHHAHAASVLAEHGWTEKALAVVCDGTGYGADGTIWGGELLAMDFKGYRRLGHLRSLRLPGGDAAAREAWRCALALLFQAFGDEFVELPIAKEIAAANDLNFIAQMLHTGSNCFTSSAAGRVFDGVAAILGLARENHFEAQAPMALESAAAKFGDAETPKHPLFSIHENGAVVIDLAPLVRALVGQRKHGMPAEESAAIFHEQFVAAWEAAVLRGVEQTGLACVALSGGVFCNQIVDRLLTDRLTARGLHVMRHRLVPPNDGGVALGQAAIAAFHANS